MAGHTPFKDLNHKVPYEPEMLATVVATGAFLTVQLVLSGAFEEMIIEVGRDNEGNFYTDVTDEVTGQRFPSGPSTFAEAMEEIVDARAYILAD